MNPHLQIILDTIGKAEISEETRSIILQALKNAGKEFDITAFKLDRTEKVKRTTAILLEETIEELEQKRKAIEETNSALKKSLEELKATQAQLIHSEKMASLGELTAGIAHEIQNPLNFVNNFSDVSRELLEEMNAELDNGRHGNAKEIARDVIQNLEKILHHGKRADSIVKGMLQHSRMGSGQKELVDINNLVDEYLRLAFHGIRAKEKSLECRLETSFDESIGMVNIVTQDIGRILVNLLNNAFYAVNEKARQGNKNYEPLVRVSTKLIDKFIQVTVSDNGNGIPLAIKEKIFQPFFTTKPTGQGTGLGLSLSYDIIKGNGGELKVESTENEGSSFIIQLPVS
jgi:two-component system NtrC family sensor kinase